MRQKSIKKGKVFVGMSGGVDSSLSATLLKKEGYDVTGVFIKGWEPDWLPCTSKEDRLDAMRVAAKLQIPFITLDLSKEYKQDVVDYMVEEYKAGRTPNPDVMCNKAIKFGSFYDFAIKNGADFVATGHYAQIKQVAGLHALSMAKDANKDQTYFLWTLTPKQLQHTLFPIGHLEKREVRKLAKKHKLPTAEKKDSQGLCFMGKINVKEFLKNFIDSRKGDVVNLEGVVIGEHEGAVFYTEGERHGFTITKKTPSDLPYYIIKKDIAKNILYVGHENEAVEKREHEIALSKVNWILPRDLETQNFLGRVRYRQSLQKCKLEKSHDERWKLVFDEGLTAVSKGQSAVVYFGEICIGGGVIV